MSESNKNLPSQKSASYIPESFGDWNPFGSLHRDLDQMFNALRSGFWRSSAGGQSSELAPMWQRMSGRALAPAVDIAETNDQYELTAELPGMDPEHVEVKIANGRLTIKGEKKEETEEEKEGYHLSERRYGSFQRSFDLPDGVDADKIIAEFKNGVLKISIPKTPELQEKEKKIAIQSR